MGGINNNISFITLNGIDDIEIVSGRYIIHRFPMHIHQKYCIGVITNGKAMLIRKNENIELSRDFVYFINPSEAHQLISNDDKGFDHIVLCFGDKFAENFFGTCKDMHVSIIFNVPSVYKEHISETAEHLLDAALYKKEGALEFELADFLSGMAPSLSNGEPDDKKETYVENIHRVCGYITENCGRNLCLKELASLSHLSRFHFSRRFKEVVGISPYDFQIQARIKSAKKMLLNKNSIAETALELRFTDQSHFTRFFKRDTGITPAQFQKKNIKAAD